MIKQIRYRFEYLLLLLLFFLFRVLGLDRASALGGWIGRTVGPRLAASRKAMANIRRAFPDRGEAEQERILVDMWENLGRVVAEYPHLAQIVAERITLDPDSRARLESLKSGHTGIVFWGAHLGNWEAGAMLLQQAFASNNLYRPPNNPYVARLLEQARHVPDGPQRIAKSRTGARDLLRVMRNGGRIAILIDQKYNEGLPVPFFGHPAMTSPVFAELAQKFDVPLVPARIERTGGAHFAGTLYPPMTLRDQETGTPLPPIKIVESVHGILEEWITAAPGQWLWLHRRWPRGRSASKDGCSKKNLDSSAASR
ncbi:MAG: hypothetical protein KDJ15_05500 [Alphaproteobacteria bacterium]|nr:hypothetical protein [Alphaproteobacteria bacterium]